jgi:hypothetical protein
MAVTIQCDTQGEADIAWGWLCRCSAPVDVVVKVAGDPVARVSREALREAQKGHSYQAQGGA